MTIFNWLCKGCFYAAFAATVMLVIASLVMGFVDLWMTNARATSLCCAVAVFVFMSARGLILTSNGR